MISGFMLPTKEGSKESYLRILPVYYILQLTLKLLSMGIFLQDGLYVTGEKSNIMFFQKPQTPLLVCEPLIKGQTTYWIYALQVRLDTFNEEHAYNILKVDYDTMHHYLGHPSKDVLCYAREHTKGFSENITIPNQNSPCLGYV